MLDPIPPSPQSLQKLVQPAADALGLTTLPLHAHEVLLAFAVYHLINTRLAPIISVKLFPSVYPRLPARTKVNWDVHVVSFFQSSLINLLALWVMWTDRERQEMDWRGRVWGYTGAGGMIQGFAAGYFVWDLMVTLRNVHAFGWGMFAHAVSALIVFSLGFRPFVNYYGPTFILYELSSPFLNIHWFCDKVNLTGSRFQLINGLILLFTFFCCRLVWGTYQSVRVYQDVWAALQAPRRLAPLDPSSPAAEVMRFSGNETVPTWLAAIYLGSNIVLNTLNFYWFGKMIDTVRRRFQPPKKDRSNVKMDIAVGTGQQNGSARLVDYNESANDGSGPASPRKIISIDESEVRRRRGGDGLTGPSV